MKPLILTCLLFLACGPVTPQTRYVNAAEDFVAQCKRTGIPRWELTARAAGDDCDVLWIESLVPLDSAMIESIHYARPDSTDDSVQTFSVRHGFRGVAYSDPNHRIWTFGAMTPAEMPTLPRCE